MPIELSSSVALAHIRRCALCVCWDQFLFVFCACVFLQSFEINHKFPFGCEWILRFVCADTHSERVKPSSQLYSNVREDAINNNWNVRMFVFHFVRACATSWSIHLSKKMRWRIHILLCFVNAHLNLHLHFRLFFSDVCVYVSKSHKTEIPLNWWTKQTHQQINK